MLSDTWVTPYLPMDHELRWRWVGAHGKKHPHLSQSLKRDQVAAKEEPPCGLDELFKAEGEWEVEKNDGTDANGWRYGLAWKASTWEAEKRMFDELRKRKWYR